MSLLGDPQLVGDREIVATRVFAAPRTLVWEALLLRRSSPLRRALAVAARESELDQDAFDFLADLRFSHGPRRDRGVVDRPHVKFQPSRADPRHISRRERPGVLQVEAGDLVAFLTAGAYGAVMSSTYNARLLVPEVMVTGDQFAVIRRRPTFAEMTALEQLPPWIE